MDSPTVKRTWNYFDPELDMNTLQEFCSPFLIQRVICSDSCLVLSLACLQTEQQQDHLRQSALPRGSRWPMELSKSCFGGEASENTLKQIKFVSN